MARDCKVRPGVTCNYCYKQGHVKSECRTKQYQGQRNNTPRPQFQNRNNGNNTREVNHINHYNNHYDNYYDNEYYGENEDMMYNNDQEVYLTTRAGNSYNGINRDTTPKPTNKPRPQHMNIDNEFSGVRRTRGQSELERMTPETNIIEVMNQTKANMTIAQMANNPTYRKQLLEALRRPMGHQELKFEDRA